MTDDRSRPTDGGAAPENPPRFISDDTVADQSVGIYSHIVGGGLR